MTNNELIEILKSFPQDKPVCILKWKTAHNIQFVKDDMFIFIKI